MATSQQATVTATAKINVNPDGISIVFEGLDTDLSNLIEAASNYTVQPIEFRTFDTSDVTILSDKKIAFVNRP